MEKKVVIKTDYITLGQFLKYIGFASDGIEAKMLLASSTILVNGEKERRRGRKLYPGMKVYIEDCSFIIGNI